MTQPITLVNDIEPRSQFTADGSQKAFPCFWPVRATTDLLILFDDGEEPEIVYSLSGLNDDQGFTVTFNTPPPSGTKITILRRGLLQRTADYGQQKRFNAASINAELADLVLRVQELRAQLNRALRLPDSDLALATILPLAADRAGKFAGFDAAGNVVALATPGQLALDFNQFTSGTPVGNDLFVFNDISEPSNPIRKATLQELATLLTSITDQPYRTSADLLLVGDGVADDSFKLQSDMDARSAEGGATYFLRSPIAGGSFYLANSPRVPSNIKLIMASPFLLAKQVTFRIRGALAGTSGADAFRLQADVSVGGTVATIDTAPHGGGALSTFFAVGDHVRLSGNRDGCAYPRHEQELRITNVADGPAQLTFAETFTSNFEVVYPSGDFETNYGTADRTTITKLVFALATSNVAEGQNLIPIREGDVGKIVAGDVVLLKDDLTTADFAGAAGSEAAACNEDLALVVPSVSGDASASLRLDRRTTRNFTTAKNFRVIKVAAVVNSMVSGARFLSAAAPDLAPAARVDWARQVYARGCVYHNCSVPNTDTFGKRGSAFITYRCLEGRIIDCDAGQAKYVAGGEGNGIVFDRSTGCKAVGGTMDAMRHSTQCVSGSGHAFHEISIINPRHAPIDAHGTYEVDCHWYDCTLTAGTRYEASEGRAPVAITFGNSTFLAGAHRCGFHGGTITGFKNDGGSIEGVINLFAGSTKCVVETTMKDVGQVFRYSDTAGFGTVLSSGHTINVMVDGCASNRAVDIHGRRNGASVNTLVDTRITIYGRRINGGFLARYATELELVNCDLDEITVDPAASYFAEAENCPGLRVMDNRTAGMGRFLALTDCTDYRVVGNRMYDQTFTTVLNDLGGCTGIWIDNIGVGFAPFWTPAATSTITFNDRFPGHWDLPDDSIIKFLPIYPKGQAVVYSITGEAFHADVFYDTVTPALDLGELSSFNVDGSTSVLTGTTGTDGRVTIAVTGDDLMYIENRTGSTMRVDGRLG